MNTIPADRACIVKFTADWCGPCKTVQPELEKLCAEHGVDLVTLKVDECQELCAEHRVASIPTMLFMCADGTCGDRVQGANLQAVRAAAARVFRKAPASRPALDVPTSRSARVRAPDARRAGVAPRERFS